MLPMENHINQMRDAIKLASGNKLDLLDNPDFKKLKEML